MTAPTEEGFRRTLTAGALSIDVLVWGRGEDDAGPAVDAAYDEVRRVVALFSTEREGAPLACESVVLDFDDKRLLCRHLMFHAKEGWQVAENEVLYLSIDLTKRRVAPWPEDILARLAARRSGEAVKRLSLKPSKR